MVIDYNGADGLFPYAPGDEADGLSYVGANYLGASVITYQYSFPDDGFGTGCVNHPLAVDTLNQPLQVCGTAGDRLIVFRLPFGSFVNTQPDAPITVTLGLSANADLGYGLDISTRGGFEFGQDPLRNPATDPSIVASFATQQVLPQVVIISKSNNTPEGETATGPNFLRNYTVNAQKAAGQQIDNFILGDNLPPQIVANPLSGSNPAGGVATYNPGNVEVEWDPWLPANNTANYNFSFYVPDTYGASIDVLSPSSGGCVPIINDIYASGSWVPLDTRDATAPFLTDATVNDNSFQACALTMQKSVALQSDLGPTGVTPGDTLQYTLNFQMSDYFAFENLFLTDTFSDGQRFDTGFTPTLSLTMHSSNTSGAFDLSNFSYLLDSPGTGSTTVDFDISAELITRLADGQVLGGCVPAGGGTPDCSLSNLGATTGTIVFRTIVQQTFSDDYPSGEPNVDQGDILTNTASISGDVLNNLDLTNTGNSNSNGSSASVTIVNGVLAEKTIYAINGSTTFGSPPSVSPGNTVTYSLTFQMPSGDVDDLVITDYLPLPVFNATEVTSFNPVADATIPPAGTAKFGAADTFYALSGIVPTLTTNAADNTVVFDYGDNQEDPEAATTVQIYFTVTLTDIPFGDNLFLTNQAMAAQGTTNTTSSISTQIVQVLVELPNLNMQKGIVSVAASAPDAVFNPATTGPIAFELPGSSPSFIGLINSTNLAADPIDSNISNVDAGDVMTFAIVIENTGGSPQGAYDVRVRDTIPAGLQVATGGLNMQVRDGTGSPVAYTPINVLDTNPLLENGIELDDGVNGAIAQSDPTNGNNIIVITYDLELDGTVEPQEILTNTATLFNYASAEGGYDYTAQDLTDTATVTSRNVAAAKSIVATSEAHTTISGGVERLVIGEVVRYRLQTLWPEGQTIGAYIQDAIPTGLQYINDSTATIAFVTNDAGMTSSTITQPTCSSGTLAIAGNQATVNSIVPSCVLADAFVSNNAVTNVDTYNNGTDVFFQLGDITNLDNDADYEYVVIEFNAIVVNTTANQTNGLRNNNYIVFDSGGSLVTSNTVGLRIAEPSITVSKTTLTPPADGNDPVLWQITITNNSSGANAAAAFNLRLTDLVDANITGVSVTHTSVPGYVTITDSTVGNSIDIEYNQLNPSNSITLQVSGTTIPAILSGQTITNTALVRYSSLPGDFGTTSNPTGTDLSSLTVAQLNPVPVAGGGGSTSQRNGQDGVGGSLNDYAATNSTSFTITAPRIDKLTEAPTPTAAIGQTGLTFDVLVTLIDGVTQDFVLIDNFPAGLAYTGATVITTAAASGGLLLDDYSGSPLIPTIPGPAASGVDISLDFGTVSIPTDANPNNNSFLVRFTALVANDILAQNGSILTNTATATYTNPNTGGTSTVNDINLQGSSVQVIEPVLRVTKTVASMPSPADAGSTVGYQVVVDHFPSSTTDAFDVILTDIVPTELTNVAVTSILIDGVTPVSHELVGNTITVPFGGTFDLGLGSSLVLLFTADITASAGPEQIIENTASIVWESQPGSPLVQRTSGTGQYDLTEAGLNGVNDYSNSGATSFQTDSVTVTKYDASNTSPRVGETVSYDILAYLPEGVIDDFVVTDEVPTGMAYSSYQVITTAAGTPMTNDFNGTITTTPTVVGGGGNGVDVSFEFGTVNVTVDNDASNNFVVVRVFLTVLNVAGNQNGVVLDNYGAISFTDPNDGVSVISARDNTPAQVTVTEPILEIAKTAISFPVDVQSGSIVTYEIEIQHAAGSTADAYEVVILDPATSQLINISNVNIFVEGTASIPSPGFGVVADTLRLPATGGFFLPNDGTTLRVTFEAEVNAGASTTINNVASVAWASDLDSNSEARDSSDSGPYDTTNTGLGGLNDYTNLDNDNQVSTNSPGLVKVIAATNAAHTSDVFSPRPLAIGEQVAFLLRVRMPEGNTSVVEVIDTFPSNLNLESYSLVTSAAGSYGQFASDFAGTIGSFPAPVLLGNSITFTLNNVDVTVNGNGADDFFGIEIIGTVTDSPGNTDGTTFNNSATLEANNSGDVVDGGTVSMTLVEPDVSISKDIVQASAAPNGVVNIQIVVANSGNTSAFDVNWEDNLDLLSAGVFSYVQASASVVCTPGVTGSVSIDDSQPPVSQTLTGTIAELPAGQSCTFSFSVTIANGATAFLQSGVNEQNQADLTNADTMPGSPSEQRSYTDSDTDSIRIIKPDLTINKDDGIAFIGPGGATTYELTINNVGEFQASGVVITETVPANTTFDPSNSTGGWLCVPDESEGSVCTFDFDAFHGSPLAPSASNMVEFAIIVNDPIPAVPSISNTASVTDDGTSGSDPTPLNNTDDDVNSTDSVVDLYVTIDDGGVDSSYNSVISYQIDYGNQGTTTSTNVEITVTVPANTEFYPASSSAGWVCVPDNSAGSVCTNNVGAVAAAGSGILFFGVMTNDYLPTFNQIDMQADIIDDGASGPDINMANNQDTDDTPIFYTNVFDPPSSIKTVNAEGHPEIEWEMVWINSGNIVALMVRVIDPIAAGTTFVTGSLTCDARGASTTSLCIYDIGNNQVVWEGDIAPDPGGTNEDDSLNEVVIRFRTTVPINVLEGENQAFAYWDDNMNGDIEDDILAGQVPVNTDDPETSPFQDPTAWVVLAPAGISQLTNVAIAGLIIIALIGIINLERFVLIATRWKQKLTDNYYLLQTQLE